MSSTHVADKENEFVVSVPRLLVGCHLWQRGSRDRSIMSSYDCTYHDSEARIGQVVYRIRWSVAFSRQSLRFDLLLDSRDGVTRLSDGKRAIVSFHLQRTKLSRSTTVKIG